MWLQQCCDMSCYILIVRRCLKSVCSCQLAAALLTIISYSVAISYLSAPNPSKKNHQTGTSVGHFLHHLIIEDDARWLSACGSLNLFTGLCGCYQMTSVRGVSKVSCAWTSAESDSQKQGSLPHWVNNAVGEIRTVDEKICWTPAENVAPVYSTRHLKETDFLVSTETGYSFRTQFLP